MPGTANPLAGWLDALATGAWHPWRESLAGGHTAAAGAPPAGVALDDVVGSVSPAAGLQGQSTMADVLRRLQAGDISPAELDPLITGGAQPGSAITMPDGGAWRPGIMVDQRPEGVAPWRAWDPAQQARLDQYREHVTRAYGILDDFILQDRATLDPQTGDYLWTEGELSPTEARRAHAALRFLGRAWPRINRLEGGPERRGE